jgi:mono/diheme cytochrome c family protein
MRVFLTALSAYAVLLASTVLGGDTPKTARPGASPEAVFKQTVQPFLTGNCVGCHNARVKMANLDLQPLLSPNSIKENPKAWKKIAWKIEQGDMPPAKSPQPKPAQKKAVLSWVHSQLQAD